MQTAVINGRLLSEIRKLILEDGLRTPAVVISKTCVDENLDFFLNETGLKSSDIFFPVKTNNHSLLLLQLLGRDCCMEIASDAELQRLIGLRANPQRILFSNPVKPAKSIENAYAAGVRFFACDHLNEIDKIAMHAPGSSISIRIDVSNDGAEWDLSGKFGADEDEVISLMQYAAAKGLHTGSLGFHTGWNNSHLPSWIHAMRTCERISEKADAAGMSVHTINLGGGFPAHLCDQFSILRGIVDVIRPVMLRLRAKGIRFVAEPGSFIVTSAAAMVIKVTDVLLRKNKKWVFTDACAFCGFSWKMSGIRYEVTEVCDTTEDIVRRPMIVTGPSCDSHDTFDTQASLPDTISANDLLLVYPAGAYVMSSKEYNGFPWPEEVFI